MNDRVLGYWEAIELAKPSKIQGGDAPFWPEHRTRPVAFQRDVSDDGELPWNDPETPAPQSGREILSTVFVGVYDLRAYLDAAGEDESGRQKSADIYATVSFMATGDGRMLPHSLQISATPWALGLLQREGAGSLDSEGWVGLEAGIRDTIQSRWAGRHLSVRDLHGIQRTVSEESGGTLAFKPWFRIQARERRVPSELSLDEWMSALLEWDDDLEQLFTSRMYPDLKQARGIQKHPALQEYLSSGTVPLQADAVHDRHAVFQGLNPDEMPLGTWPSPGHRALNLAQRFALARTRRDLADGGLFAVNGPPGTGKTTMIRELAADLIVQRAQAMVRIGDPEAALREGVPEEIAGYELIVCTHSNKAAQRVSTELPRLSEVDPYWHDRIGLFRQTTPQVVRSYQRSAEIDLQGLFGTLALPLGNLKMRQACCDGLWPDPRRLREENLWSLGRLLHHDLEDVEPPAVADWPTACRRFREAVARAERERAAAVQAYRVPHQEHRLRLLRERDEQGPIGLMAKLERLEKPDSDPDALAREIRQLEERLLAQQEAVRSRVIEARKGAAQEVREIAAEKRALTPEGGREERMRWQDAGTRLASAQGRLGALESLETHLIRSYRYLLGLGGGRALSKDDQSHIATLRELLDPESQAAADRLRSLRQQHIDAQSEWSAYTRAHAELSEAIDVQRREVRKEIRDIEAHLEERRKAARERFGENAVDAEQWDAGGPDLERLSPWVGETATDGNPGGLQAARAEVFLAALALHEAFAVAGRKALRRKLSAFFAMLRRDTGWREQHGHQGGPADLWRAFFLVVPVVSTTFHSVRKLFAGVGSQEFGWTVVDEAGQAEPQSAVGAMLRSRRAVILGDPMQLEPILDLPDAVADRIATRLHDTPAWDPRRQSVQTLADRRCPVGSKIETGSMHGQRVGCPLRVHWRCDEPMVSISAGLAYGDLMVKGTIERADVALPQSGWLHVPRTGPADQGHFVADEMPALIHLLDQIDRAGLSVYVITPYRDVVAGLNRTLRPTAHARLLTEGRVGTVHTFQGREEDVVIIVLGGTGSMKAREFTHEKPNFLNVAVTRARRRLYVIGDRDSWGKLPFYKVLAQQLPEPEAGAAA
ncbi:DEAD/DEAH box helicase [Rhodovibrio sodomensis]|nr:ATP-binding protein [Rhodovibrio sodomensis]